MYPARIFWTARNTARRFRSCTTVPGIPCHYLLFSRNGRDIGFALAVLFRSEDGKCFLMEFCVLPEFRGGRNRPGLRAGVSRLGAGERRSLCGAELQHRTAEALLAALGLPVQRHGRMGASR
jgi:hypothetical protein